MVGTGFDTVSADRSYSATDLFDAEAKRARFRLGPLLLFPQLGISGIGYTNGFQSHTGDTQSNEPKRNDITATASGGIRALLPVGTRYRISGDVTLAYQWYLDSVELRRLSVNSSVAALAEVGRVRLDVRTAIYSATIPLSSEVQVRTNERTGGVSGGVSVPLGDRLFLSGRVDFRNPTYETGGRVGEDAARLNRREVAYGGGLLYELNTRFSLNVSLQATQARYSNEAYRDTDSTGYSFGIRYGRDRTFANAQVSYRTYDQSNGRHSGLYGAVSGGFAIGRFALVQFQAYRGRTDSLFLDQTAFDEERVYGALGYTFERLLGLRLTAGAEIGDNRYTTDVTIDGITYRRRDDVFTYRGTAGITIGRFATVSGTLSRSRYTSNTPGFDREVTDIAINFSIFTGGIQLIK